MFQDFIVQPIFNLLVTIYALLPGHNFGLALVIFTIIVRLLMWPLVKKQLHHASAIRKLQPELKRIKQESKGDRQKESMMVMELYKEREISPFGSIGILVMQLIILFGLYSGLNKLIHDPKAVVDFAYPFLQNLGWMKSLAENIGQFDATFLGVVDLTRAAVGENQGFYFPAFVIVVGSAVTQYYQSKQLMPSDKDARSLKQILKEAGEGKQADQAEVNAAISRGTKYFIPALIFVFTISLPSALGLYWFVSGLVAFWQQDRILKQDEEELEEIADKPTKTVHSKAKKASGHQPSKITILEGEVVQKKTQSKKKSSKSSKKRRN